METQATNSTHTTTNVISTQSTQTNKTENTVFELLQSEPKDPQSISYDEYKELTREQIDTLYPKESSGEQNSIVHSLYIKAHFSDDEVLNKVMFDKELEAMSSLEGEEKEAVQTAIDMDNQMFELWSSMAYTHMAIEATMAHLETFAMTKDFAKDYTMEAYAFTFSKTMQMTIGEETRSVSYHTAITYTPETGIDRATLFGAYDSMSEQFKMIESNWSYDGETIFSKSAKAVVEYHDDIKNEYDKRMEEKNSLLHYYTKTQSYSYAEYFSNKDNIDDHKHERENFVDHITQRDEHFDRDESYRSRYHVDFEDRREDHHRKNKTEYHRA